MDPEQIAQILSALCSNASDAVAKLHETPVVEIFARETMLDNDFFEKTEVQKPGRYVCFGVLDNGSGMTPEMINKITEPFFTTKREKGALGLGLTLVEGIVHQNNGYMRVDSTQENSTCISLFFPCV
jgi:signal transduction histidine kinase